MNRRLLWSLLIALLLPLAQVAAAAHELSHVQASEAGSKSAPVAAHCDLCAVAASISGGGAPSTAPVLALAQVEAPAPIARVEAAHFTEPFTAFASRAPPVLP